MSLLSLSASLLHSSVAALTPLANLASLGLLAGAAAALLPAAVGRLRDPAPALRAAAGGIERATRGANAPVLAGLGVAGFLGWRRVRGWAEAVRREYGGEESGGR